MMEVHLVDQYGHLLTVDGVIIREKGGRAVLRAVVDVRHNTVSPKLHDCEMGLHRGFVLPTADEKEMLRRGARILFDNPDGNGMWTRVTP